MTNFNSLKAAGYKLNATGYSVESNGYALNLYRGETRHEDAPTYFVEIKNENGESVSVERGHNQDKMVYAAGVSYKGAESDIKHEMIQTLDRFLNPAHTDGFF